MRSAAVLCALLLSGCGNPLIWGKAPPPEPEPKVVRCDELPTFGELVDCTQSYFKEQRLTPALRAYLSELNSIREDFNQGKLSDIKARAAGDRVFLDTVGKEHEAMMNRAALRAPIYVRQPMACHRFGTSTYCY